MGRAPCCDKVGLKRGPWTPEEDQILMSFIQKHGHTNWRALPKQAGLLRCGKSCRLRWINYLRPDIKRGNFTKEEEDTIIQLHEMMGNRWSAIAGKLPGRTDNEIKNVWHTHLKKKLEKYQPQGKKDKSRPKHSDADNVTATNSTCTNNFSETSSSVDNSPTSPQRSYSSDDFSSISEVSSTVTKIENEQMLDIHQFDLPVIDETFWSSEAQEYANDTTFVFSDMGSDDLSQLQFSEKPEIDNNCTLLYPESKIDGDMDFWLDVFVKSGELPEF